MSPESAPQTRSHQKHDAKYKAEARTAAKKYFQEGKRQADIARDLGYPDPERQGKNRVSKMISEAKKDLVELTVTYKFEEPPEENEDLANELAEAAGLNMAYVARAVGNEPDDPKDWTVEHSDELHFRLGHLAARHLKDVLANNAVVGVGTGRGVAHTIRALRQIVAKQRLRFRDLKVFSLVGAMWVRLESMEPSARDYHYIDSDQSALELANMFHVDWHNLHLVWLPRAFSRADPVDFEDIAHKVAPHLAGDDWTTDVDDERIDLTLFGVGVWDPEHYWWRHGEAQMQAIPEMKKLETLLVPEYKSALIDVCDRLHLRAGQLPEDIRAEAAELVDALNKRFLVVTFPKLNAADRRWMVAGGPEKVDAMLEVLADGTTIGIKPTVVVTDEWTSRELIKKLPRT